MPEQHAMTILRASANALILIEAAAFHGKLEAADNTPLLTIG